jgi:capsular polysaccharide biosynthesis protein
MNNNLDLIEISQIVKTSKVLIFTSTILITLLVFLYGVSKPDLQKSYSSSAIIQIGSYQGYNINLVDMWIDNIDYTLEKLYLEDMDYILDDLKSAFIILPKVRSPIMDYQINSIEKRSNSLIEVSAFSANKSASQDGIRDLIDYISTKHRSIYLENINRINSDFDIKISRFNSESKSISRDIELNEFDLEIVNQKIKINEQSNQILLLALKTERNQKHYQINLLLDRLDLINQNLDSYKKLKTKLSQNQNFINTQIMGEITTEDKSLIRMSPLSHAIIGFFLGLVFSLIIVSLKIALSSLKDR